MIANFRIQISLWQYLYANYASSFATLHEYVIMSPFPTDYYIFRENIMDDMKFVGIINCNKFMFSVNLEEEEKIYFNDLLHFINNNNM